MKFLALLVLALAAMKSLPSSVRPLGIQQRMQQLRCRADELPDEDAFVKKKFAQGKLSASEMYDGSRTVKKGKTKFRVRQGIVKVDDRNHSRHILRKLRREPTRRLPRPYYIKIPLWDRDAAKQIMGEVAVLNPHEILHSWIPAGSEMEFLQSDAEQQPFMDDVALVGKRLGLKDVSDILPIGIWGDSAPVGARNSVYVLLLTILSGGCRRRIRLCGLNRYNICACGCRGRHTFDGIFSWLGWSFSMLLSGFFPTIGFMGETLTGWRAKLSKKAMRIRGLCVRKFGDWQWHAQAAGLQNWSGSGALKRCCWLCYAGFNMDMYAFDFSLGAGWRFYRATMRPLRKRWRKAIGYRRFGLFRASEWNSAARIGCTLCV